MIKLFVFDLDGTLWRGEEAIDGAVDALEAIRKRPVQFRFVTNNSTITPNQVVEKLNRLGFRAKLDEVLCTSTFAAKLCQEADIRKVFIIGEQALIDAFSQFEQPKSGDVDVVVAGLDRKFTYAKCNQALQHIRRGAKFVATNRDATYPLEGGLVEPGAGAIVGSIEAATGKEPFLVGKPSPRMFKQCWMDAQVNPKETLIIGDRYETDIVAGRAAHCNTALVLTGATLDPVEGVRTAATVADLIYPMLPSEPVT